MPRDGSPFERKYMELMVEDQLGIAVRSTGSFGEDIIWITPPPIMKATVVEIKSKKKRPTDKYHYFRVSDTEHLIEQFKSLKHLSELGYDVWYGIRWIGVKEHHGTDERDKWEFFNLNDSDNYINRKGQIYPTFKIGTGISYYEYVDLVMK